MNNQLLIIIIAFLMGFCFRYLNQPVEGVINKKKLYKNAKKLYSEASSVLQHEIDEYLSSGQRDDSQDNIEESLVRTVDPSSLRSCARDSDCKNFSDSCKEVRTTVTIDGKQVQASKFGCVPCKEKYIDTRGKTQTSNNIWCKL